MTLVKKIRAAWLLSIFLLSTVMVPQVSGITIQEEEEFGQEFMDFVNTQYKLVKDPYIEHYVNDLGHKLLKQFGTQLFEYHFYVVDQDVYNAFAAPAGHVFVNSGLIAAMDSEAELAGIIGHEISHVTCRHISESIARSGKIQIGTLAGMMAGILLGATGSGSASSALLISSMAAGQSAYLAYSREDEKEADEVGVKALMGAGYPVEGLITMLHKIKDKDWYGSDIPSYLGTHPGVDERIVYLSRFIDYSEVRATSTEETPELDFKRVHTRVMALYSDPVKATAWFESQAKKQPEDFLPDYGMGLLALRAKKLEDAKASFKLALEKRAFDPYVLADLGQTYFEGGEYPAARKVLEAAVRMDTKNLEGRLFLGRTLQATENFSEAQGIFERLSADAPDYAIALYYLGDTYNKQGRTAEAHYYLGLYYLQINDTKRATFNLKRARMETEDESLRQKIDAAMKKAELKEKKDKEKDKGKGKGNSDEEEQRPGFQTLSKWENCMVKVPRPWVPDLRTVE